MNNPEKTLKKVLLSICESVEFTIISGKKNINERTVKFDRVNVLGLELAGFVKTLRPGQLQVIDSNGINYLKSLGATEREKNLKSIFSRKIPAVFFPAGARPDKIFKKVAESYGVPLISADYDRWSFVRMAEAELEDLFAPVIDYRGTMMEVYGVGVLISGKSNVGKSECAIDLLQRGHRMIGDDIIELKRRGSGTLLAGGKYPISNRMELRGIGIVDIVRLFGISAIKEIQRIDLIVELERWNPEKTYDRLGLEEKHREILDVKVPYKEVPVAPGRNTAILVEVSAMNHRLRKKGIVAAQELENEVLECIRGGKDND